MFAVSRFLVCVPVLSCCLSLGHQAETRPHVLPYAVKQGERSGLLMGLCVHHTDTETWLRESLRLSLAVRISLDLVSDIYMACIAWAWGGGGMKMTMM